MSDKENKQEKELATAQEKKEQTTDQTTDQTTNKISDKVEVIEKLLELTDTVEEGIQQIEKQLKELRFEESILLLQDVVKAIASMQKALAPLLANLPENEVNPLTKELMEQVGEFIEAYQNGKKEEMSDLMSKKLATSYAVWKEELVRILKPLLTN